MRKVWLNNKEPDENGDYILEIQNDEGNRVSTFKGKTMEEVADALADSQIHANRQLGRLLKPDKGRDTPLKVEPKDVPPQDRLRLASEITDPNRVVEAVEEIVTARQGVPPSTVGQRTSRLEQEAADRYYREEAEAFVTDHPNYYPVQQNMSILFRALEERGYDLTRNNLAIVYDALAAQGRLIQWPQSETAEPPAPVANPPQHSRASGLRSSDASALKPAPVKRPVVTYAEIDRMSKAEFNERLRDPVFRRAVDALGTQA